MVQCIRHTCHCITRPRILYSSSRYQVPPSLHQTKYTQVYRCLQGHRFEAPWRPAKKKKKGLSLSLRKQQTFCNTTTGFRNFQWNNIWGKSTGNYILMIYYYSDLGSACDPSYNCIMREICLNESKALPRSGEWHVIWVWNNHAHFSKVIQRGETSSHVEHIRRHFAAICHSGKSQSDMGPLEKQQ